MTKSRLFVVATFVLAILALLVGVGPATSHAEDVSVDGQNDFSMAVRLNHEERFVVIEAMNGLPSSQGFFEITVFYDLNGMVESATSVVPINLDVNGSYQAYAPIAFTSSVTNFELHISAYNVQPDGSFKHAREDWRFGTMLLGNYSELQEISPMAVATLGGTDSSSDTSSLVSSLEEEMGPPLPPPGASFAFTSQTTGPSGDFILSGQGNYMAAAPDFMFAATSGPTGIFTAN